MYLSIVFMPLFGAVCSGFLGRYFGYGSGVLSSFFVFYSFISSVTAFIFCLLYGSVIHFSCCSWVHVGSFYVNWGFLFDTLTCVILVVVTSVSFLVHLYSIEYIAEDPHKNRFMSYLSFFTFFILVLVTGDNLVQIFLGWEGVGLCSFLLINFWYTRIQANKAAIKAILVNRVGDFFLALGIFFIYKELGTVEYLSIFATSPNLLDTYSSWFFYDVNSLFFGTLFLFFGAVGKSAQLGLHSWLPDAIEGPTPVSALIHAATIVTAGVFLLARCSPLFEYAPATLEIVTFVGAITAFFAATVGLVQNDLKKVIAYSTCSQLGYMVFSCGLSNYSVSVFHLANHAFFKALLFLTAGAVIHALQDEQDIRRIGGLVRLLPFSYAIILIGSLALAGFPFLTGFYSKDVVLEIAYARYTSFSFFAYCLGTIGALFTAFYSIRLLSITFFTKPKGFFRVYQNVHEAPVLIIFALLVLGFGSLFFGYLMKDLFIGVGTFFWRNSLFMYPLNSVSFDAEFLTILPKLIPMIFSFSGLVGAYVLYNHRSFVLYNFKVSFVGRQLYNFFNRKWFFDKVQIDFIVQPAIINSYVNTYQNLDRGLFELFGPYGFSQILFNLVHKTYAMYSGFVYHALFLIVLNLSGVVVVFLLNYYLSDFLVTSFLLFNYNLVLVFFLCLFF